MNGLGFAATIALGVLVWLIWEYWPAPAPDPRTAPDGVDPRG